MNHEGTSTLGSVSEYSNSESCSRGRDALRSTYLNDPGRVAAHHGLHNHPNGGLGDLPDGGGRNKSDPDRNRWGGDRNEPNETGGGRGSDGPPGSDDRAATVLIHLGDRNSSAAAESLSSSDQRLDDVDLGAGTEKEATIANT